LEKLVEKLDPSYSGTRLSINFSNVQKLWKSCGEVDSIYSSQFLRSHRLTFPKSKTLEKLVEKLDPSYSGARFAINFSKVQKLWKSCGGKLLLSISVNSEEAFI
jgi:hypothetical protein